MHKLHDGMDMVDAAAAYGLAGCSCSESVAYAFASQVGCDPLLALRAASGFAGGMGVGEATCGAVAAAMMLLGCRFGPKSPNDKEGSLRARALARKFADRMIEARGSTLCAELRMGHSISTPEGIQALRESGLAIEVIRCAAGILADMLLEEPEWS